MSNKLANNEAAHTRRLRAIEAVASMGMNLAEAAAYSGLKPKTISAMLKDKRVRKYIAKLRSHQDKRLKIKREDVVGGVLDAIDRAKMLGEPSNEIKGWDLIAKLEGLHAPERVIHELPEEARELVETLRSMDSAEIAKLANAGDIIELSQSDFQQVDEQ